jgi:uncharacterized protein (DUF4213/DUF364 family)
MWTLYDVLINGIPLECRVDEAVTGAHWTMVRSGANVGIAMSMGAPTRPQTLPECCEGMALRELAKAAKSWNFKEAALGMAAINAFWNSPGCFDTACDLGKEGRNGFDVWRKHVDGKKVAVIGHFKNLEKSLGEVCELSILEKRPQHGDYPDSACEFILPLQDFVFATGVTLINKTLPRLLKISTRAEFILVGPSVPLCPGLFSFGVRDLQGFTVTEPDLARDFIYGKRPDLAIFDSGRRINIARS